MEKDQILSEMGPEFHSWGQLTLTEVRELVDAIQAVLYGKDDLEDECATRLNSLLGTQFEGDTPAGRTTEEHEGKMVTAIQGFIDGKYGRTQTASASSHGNAEAIADAKATDEEHPAAEDHEPDVDPL